MPGPLGEDRFLEVAAGAIELPGADGIEVVLLHDWGGLTRFANSEIHQSTASEDTSLRVRVVDGGKVGVASTNDCSREGARTAASSALEMARVSTPDPFWPGLAPVARVPEDPRFDETTAGCSPEMRAETVAALVGRCEPGFVAAGAFETRAVEVALTNSEGQRCWSASTHASISTVLTGGEGGSGFAESFAGTVDEIDPEGLGDRASAKAVGSQRAGELPAGRYTVVLEPSATATLIGFLAWIGFGGRAYIEDRSCLSGKAGQTVAAPGVSIWDDGSDRRTIGTNFDFEGVPKTRTDLIRNGVFVDAVYDLRTAKQAGRAQGSTGHALPSPNPEGAFPLNLFMDPGDASVDEMVSATTRGLLVTRFHYSNVVNPIESTITGMTRDGTFLIEKGEVVGPVRNLRFTQSILGALAGVTMIGRDAELASEFFFSASRVPALKIEAFHFSGVSDH
jgi:PmbA protein